MTLRNVTNIFFNIMTENEIAYQIVGASLDLHREVGPGLLESAYESALLYELRERGLSVKQQCAMPFIIRT